MGHKVVVTEKFAKAWKEAHGFIPHYFLVTPDRVMHPMDKLNVKEVEEQLNEPFNKSKQREEVKCTIQSNGY